MADGMGGVDGYPAEEATSIALETVRQALEKDKENKVSDVVP